MTVPTASSAAWDLVAAHEQSASSDERAARGAWYTPRRVVDTVVELALGHGSAARERGAWIPDRVVDPTCGAGAFLLGVLDRLVALGVEADAALNRVGGTDIDEGAVAACRDVLEAWAAQHGVAHAVVVAAQARVRQADALAAPVMSDGAQTTLVIGNPPFATPLRGRVFPPTAVEFREQHRDRFGPYADLAALHVAAAIDGLRIGDRLALVLPQSVVSSRDVQGLRAELDSRAPVVAAWATDELVFDANVRVWAPVFEVGASEPSEPWRLSVADALGGPVVHLDGEPLGSRVTATAGFRDEYYGVAEVCREAQGIERTVSELIVATVGSLDPLWSWWGIKPTTFAKQRWDRPVVDPAALDGRVARWAEQLRRPKILLPTQSKIFEPVIDHDGSMVPVTPVLALWPSDSPAGESSAGPALTLEHLAAMLLAPPLVAWSRRNWFGAAMSTSAIKLPAAGLADLPMPPDRTTWDSAASQIARRGSVSTSDRDHTEVAELVDEVAVLMNAAYAADESVLEWWRTRRRKQPRLKPDRVGSI